MRWPQYWSWLFTSSGKSIGVSALALSVNIQGWFPSGLPCLISLLSKRLSRVFSSTSVWKHQFLGSQHFFMDQLSYPYVTTGKAIALTIRPFISKMMSLLFNMLSRLVIAFLSSLLISGCLCLDAFLTISPQTWIEVPHLQAPSPTHTDFSRESGLRNSGKWQPGAGNNLKMDTRYCCS